MAVHWALGVGDRVYTMKIPGIRLFSRKLPTILWRSWDYKTVAAEQLKLTAKKNVRIWSIDGIIPEPEALSGDYTPQPITVRSKFGSWNELKDINPQERINDE